MTHTDCGNLGCLSPNALSMLPEVTRATLASDGVIRSLCLDKASKHAVGPGLICVPSHTRLLRVGYLTASVEYRAW